MANRGADLLEWTIEGVVIPPPIEWPDLTYKATADDILQPAVEVQELTFVNEANRMIRERISSGLSGGLGIFEGLGLRVQQKDLLDVYNSWNGFTDLTTFRAIDEVRCSCRVTTLNDFTNIQQTLFDLTYGYLYDIKEITDSDFSTVPFLIEKRTNFLELGMAIILFIQLRNELNNAIYRTSKAIGDVSLAISRFPDGPITGIIYAILIAALEIAYTLFILALLLDLMTDWFKNFFPPLGEHKVMTWRKLLEIPLQFMGFSLNTNLPLDELVYLPSNKSEEEANLIDLTIKPKGTKYGFPNVTEGAYNFGGFLEVVERQFGAKWFIRDGVFNIFTTEDEFFRKKSGVQLPGTSQTLAFNYNAEDLINTFIVEYLTDTTDDFTLDNYKGTAYQNTTQPITFNDRLKVGIKGTEIVSIPLALGTRKDQLNNFEKFCLAIAEALEDVLGFFGSNASFSDKILLRVGALKQSQEFFNVPKVLKVSGGQITFDSRAFLNAGNIYKTYYQHKSFVANNYRAQKIRFDGVRIQFKFEDFLRTIENTMCIDENGNEARITSIDYNPYEGAAVISYYIERPYTTSLKEIKFLPG
jgi:hypothetical protein